MKKKDIKTHQEHSAYDLSKVPKLPKLDHNFGEPRFAYDLSHKFVNEWEFVENK